MLHFLIAGAEGALWLADHEKGLLRLAKGVKRKLVRPPPDPTPESDVYEATGAGTGVRDDMCGEFVVMRIKKNDVLCVIDSMTVSGYQ
jgi:hypothetical protein